MRFDGLVGIPDGAVSDALEALAAAPAMHFKNAINLFAEKEVREADNAGASFGRTVDAARRHCGDAVDELGFAYGRQSKHPPPAGIHGVALQIDGRVEFVAVIGVGREAHRANIETPRSQR